MITLITSLLSESTFQLVSGIVIAILELVAVVLFLISYFIPADSKAAKVLSVILRGLMAIILHDSSKTDSNSDDSNNDDVE